MNKIVSLILTMAMCFSLTSCGKTTSNSTSDISSSIASTSQRNEDSSEVSSEKTSAEPEEHTDDVVFDFTTFTDSDWGEVETGDLRIMFGDLLSVTYCDGNVVVVKAKIESSYNNKSTIEQNYYNVCNLIRDNGFNTADEIQYWAVADTVSGEEVKAISFTVGKDMIDMIASQPFPDNTLGEYVSDLYILPSLQD